MNFVWTRRSSTWDIDGEVVTDHSAQTGVAHAYIGDLEFLVDTASGYNPSTHGTYKFRVEQILTDSNGPDAVYLAELQHRQATSGDYVLEERYGTATYVPGTGGYTDVVWKGGFQTVASSNVPFGSVTMTIFLITRDQYNGFYSIPRPGNYDLTIRHYPDGVEAFADAVGTAQIRALVAENIRLDCPFDPLEGPGQVSFDVLAYPDGWFPQSGIDWKFREQTGTEALSTPVSVGNGWRVAQISTEWDGKYEGEPIVGLADLYVSLLADVDGPGNTFNFENGLGVLFHRKCGCAPETGEVSFTVPIPLGGSSLSGGLSLTYKSFYACRGPNSFGYGWTSYGSALLTEVPLTGDLIYRDEGGRVMKWLEDNGVYTPVRPDNYTQVQSLGNPGAPYRLIFRDQTTREFNSSGKLTQETDRNGNTTTYTYTTGGDLETISDGRGGLLTYDYGARIDGQPVSIRSGDPQTGRLVQFGYNGSSLASITNPAGEVVEFEYGAGGRLVKQTEVRPTQGDRVIEHTYDELSGRRRYSDFYDLWREEYWALPWSEYASLNDSEIIVGPIPDQGHLVDGRGFYYFWDSLGRTLGIERNRIGLIF